MVKCPSNPLSKHKAFQQWGKSYCFIQQILSDYLREREEALSECNPAWMCIVDMGTTMPRISMLQPQGSGKSFPWWSSEEWQSPPLVLVQILTVCADYVHCSFLIPGCLWPQTASLQRLLLPRLTKPASSFIYHNSHFLDSTVCRNSSLLNLHNKHSDLPGYYSFTIGEPKP